MITGDHPDTALAIARDLGIAADGDRVVSGTELDALSDDELERRRRTDPRLRPRHGRAQAADRQAPGSRAGRWWR